jgi:hypothetical protein
MAIAAALLQGLLQRLQLLHVAALRTVVKPAWQQLQPLAAPFVVRLQGKPLCGSQS